MEKGAVLGLVNGGLFSGSSGDTGGFYTNGPAGKFSRPSRVDS